METINKFFLSKSINFIF